MSEGTYKALDSANRLIAQLEVKVSRRDAQILSLSNQIKSLVEE